MVYFTQPQARLSLQLLLEVIRSLLFITGHFQTAVLAFWPGTWPLIRIQYNYFSPEQAFCTRPCFDREA